MAAPFYAYIVPFIQVASIIIGLFFCLRSINKYHAWRNDENAEMWMFLSFLIGGIALLLCGYGIMVLSFIESIGGFLLLFVGLGLGVAAIGLATFYYINTWRQLK
ncbi:MAG TPA: hypothetical protein VMV49_04000 [Candidatus Deferrimicrobium sp.]|nr:hypothetical protein [Candidatus Deferrimicrobium sp.]